MITVEIEFRTVKLVVEGTFIPGEPEIRYFSDMSGQQGYPDTFDVNAVYVGDVDIYELFSNADISEIERECLINIEE